jgi:predicted DCC family thiol-disulfide oxidoreductase YuxK
VARVVAGLDRAEELAFLPMRDADAVHLLEPLPEEERFATWHLVLPDRALVGYGAGGVELLRTMRLTRPLARLLERSPSGLLDAGYAFVAHHRIPLGRVVPDRPGPRRYP